MVDRDPAAPVYGIAVAADLLGVPEATLRLYESKGLLEPSRTAGGTRRYSDDDLERLRRVADLRDEGINIAGIRRVLDLEDENQDLRNRALEDDGGSAPE
ncbi:MerR family transcriptional regulator [Labedella phragmitis]|uniref:MerR family transcriptional regulator n=1 Tax=Labedella phragmitis TaxID=2498849 RepID=A0A3S3Z6E9_9MICO|nr:MerR family transcriptional regulator [Labedella phragmitis]RWZ52849.1 MerR family transcriptional regulator [Labedella phragmitis]